MKCLKPCKHITYTGSSLELAEATLLETSNTQAIFQMIIHDIRRVQKERLYYDTFDMIGAIGGSLGLFLGFSFFDVICKCMNKLSHLIKYWSGRELEFIEPGRGIRKVSYINGNFGNNGRELKRADTNTSLARALASTTDVVTILTR